MSDDRQGEPRDLRDMEPGDEAMRSLRSAAERGERYRPPAVADDPPTRTWGLGGLMGIALALLTFAGLATAVVIINKHPDGTSLPKNPVAEAALRESPYLAGAPWLFQRDGLKLIQDQTQNPSLVFPPRTTYAAAVRALVTSVIATGEIPEIAKPGPPLEKGVVWERDLSGPRLSLVSPVGYTVPGGAIVVPSFVIDGSLPSDEAVRLGTAIQAGEPVGDFPANAFRLGVPTLERCQVAPRPRPCKLQEPAG